MSRQGDPFHERSSSSGLEIFDSPSHSGGESDDDNWIISYADMMTLLFGFFAMLFTYATFDDDSYIKMRKELARFFGGTYAQTAGGADAPGQEGSRPGGRKASLLSGSDLRQSEDGTEISLITGLSFLPGSSQLTEEAKGSLKGLVGVLKDFSVPFKKPPELRIEGHTDDTPLRPNGHFRSNWELSAARAGSIADYLESIGVPGRSIAAMGYGAARPAYPNRDAKGARIPENLERNRRVVIKVIYPKDANRDGKAPEAPEAAQ